MKEKGFTYRSRMSPAVSARPLIPEATRSWTGVANTRFGFAMKADTEIGPALQKDYPKQEDLNLVADWLWFKPTSVVFFTVAEAVALGGIVWLTTWAVARRPPRS